MVGKVLHGVEKFGEVQIEGYYHCRAKPETQSEIEGNGDGGYVDKGYKRAVNSERYHHLVAGFAQVFVFQHEFKLFIPAAVENAYELHSRKVFVEVGVQLGDILPLPSEQPAYNFTEHEGNHPDRRNECEHH